MQLIPNANGQFHVEDAPYDAEPSTETAKENLMQSDDDGTPAEPALSLPHNMMVEGGKILVEDGNGKPREVCDFFEVVAKTRDEGGRNCGRLLRITTPHGHVHEFSIPMKDLDSAEPVKQLRDVGLSINYTYDRATSYVKAYIQDMEVERVVTCVTQCGWHNDIYVSPHGVFPDTGNIVLQVRQQEYKGICSKGTLEEWKTHVATPCRGNHRFILGMSTALAAPILPLVSDEGGGLHYEGHSSTGKTTLLHVAASTCGSPDYKKQWRTTDNGMEGLCTLYNHMVLILDEIGQVDEKKLSDIVYMATNGQAKNRSTSDVMLRNTAVWQVMILSTGEMTIGDKIKEGGKKVRAGVTNRMVDIPADAGKGHGTFDVLNGAADGATLSNQLKDAAAKYYGTAFPAFMRYIVTIKASIPARYKAMKDTFLTSLDVSADGQVRRVAERFAVIALGGELAIEAGILPYDAGEALESARVCFLAWVVQRGGQGAHERAQALQQVRYFLELHQASRFQDVLLDGEGESPATTYNLAGYIKEIDGERYFLIQPEVFKADVCKGLDHKFVCDVLHKEGHLLRGDDKNLTKLHRVNGLGTPKRFYTIKHSILDGGQV